MNETIAASGEQILVIDDSPANIDLLACHAQIEMSGSAQIEMSAFCK